jgi:hypothetical protein
MYQDDETRDKLVKLKSDLNSSNDDYLSFFQRFNSRPAEWVETKKKELDKLKGKQLENVLTDLYLTEQEQLHKLKNYPTYEKSKLTVDEENRIKQIEYLEKLIPSVLDDTVSWDDFVTLASHVTSDKIKEEENVWGEREEKQQTLRNVINEVIRGSSIKYQQQIDDMLARVKQLNAWSKDLDTAARDVEMLTGIKLVDAVSTMKTNADKVKEIKSKVSDISKLQKRDRERQIEYLANLIPKVLDDSFSFDEFEELARLLTDRVSLNYPYGSDQTAEKRKSLDDVIKQLQSAKNITLDEQMKSLRQKVSSANNADEIAKFARALDMITGERFEAQITSSNAKAIKRKMEKLLNHDQRIVDRINKWLDTSTTLNDLILVRDALQVIADKNVNIDNDFESSKKLLTENIKQLEVTNSLEKMKMLIGQLLKNESELFTSDDYSKYLKLLNLISETSFDRQALKTKSQLNKIPANAEDKKKAIMKILKQIN